MSEQIGAGDEPDLAALMFRVLPRLAALEEPILRAAGLSIAELNLYEVFGITARGKGAVALEDGTVYPDGRLPVNVSGGLKAKGHPVGATGVSQHVIAAMQLTGTAGRMQLPDPRRAAVHNMGGLAVANYVSVLEAV